MYTWTVFKGSADGTIREGTTTRAELIDDQVFLAITAAGLCGTDEHFRYLDMVLGHEGVGIVLEIGPNVRNLRRGDRVGWGYQHDSCHSCKNCLSGDENYCPDGEIFGESNLDQGAFATHAIWKESFLLQLLDSLSNNDAAPLMCAGATVFSALKASSHSPGDRIGVLGMGGLGHLAIQFAAKQGCRVVVFSHNEEKREDALKLGAQEFYVVKETAQKEGEIEPLDLLLVTVSQRPELHYLTHLMAPKGRIVLVTILDGDIEIPLMPLVTKGLYVGGSVIAPRHCSIEMLDFAARNCIKPVVQNFTLNIEGITEAMRLLEQGKMRYRAVLVPDAGCNEATHCGPESHGCKSRV